AASQSSPERPMQRRDFLVLAAGTTTLALTLPGWRAIAAAELASMLDPALKRALADVALQAARDAGASYCDVRIGCYLRQSLSTRESRVQNVVNSESTGVGIRVLAGGAWGFAATNALLPDAVARATRQATAIARANAGIQDSPVQLAPAPALGERSWRTPLRRNGMEVPVQEKIELLLGVNAAAM